ncbi:hypothetical protein GCM10011346_20290 [Oceanobacillus neutriphilus]|uniref:YxiJ-like protein n=2 Tax=Oceanobacillus neutriphilus TaxID=531815 RepID=A0ABQ2NUE9_9BACI|nr:hypothetical protein GCM10011346_20290 [Oceanobacillus neutriphilus]
MAQEILTQLNKLYPIHFTKMEAVTDEMFRCVAEEENYFARITNYKSFDEQLEEVNYTDFLYKKGLGVSPAISSFNGKAVEKLPLFFKLKEVFEYSLMHMYWDKERLTEDQIRIMNHFRMRIEQKSSFFEM